MISPLIFHSLKAAAGGFTVLNLTPTEMAATTSIFMPLAANCYCVSSPGYTHRSLLPLPDYIMLTVPQLPKLMQWHEVLRLSNLLHYLHSTCQRIDPKRHRHFYIPVQFMWVRILRPIINHNINWRRYHTDWNLQCRVRLEVVERTAIHTILLQPSELHSAHKWDFHAVRAGQWINARFGCKSRADCWACDWWDCCCGRVSCTGLLYKAQRMGFLVQVFKERQFREIIVAGQHAVRREWESIWGEKDKCKWGCKADRVMIKRMVKWFWTVIFSRQSA